MPFFFLWKAMGNQARNQGRRMQLSFIHHDKKRDEKRARAKEVPEILKKEAEAGGWGRNAADSGKESASTNKLETIFGLYNI